MTSFEKLKAALTEAGIPFETTDDSEESEIEALVDTVVVLKETDRDGNITGSGQCYIFFRRDGSYKEIDIIL